MHWGVYSVWIDEGAGTAIDGPGDTDNNGSGSQYTTDNFKGTVIKTVKGTTCSVTVYPVTGTNPKPSMIDLVVLNPRESFSAHIKGNWVVSEINKPITKYGAAALFYYDSDAPEYNEGRNWDLAVTNSK